MYLSKGQWVFSADGKSLGYTDDEPWTDHFDMLLRLQATLGAIPQLHEEPMGSNMATVAHRHQEVRPWSTVHSNQLVGLWTAAANGQRRAWTANFKLYPLPKVTGGHLTRST